ncbi:MAG: hypothetical protein ABR530_07420 [Pyrinomonadaceae bacterium]
MLNKLAFFILLLALGSAAAFSQISSAESGACNPKTAQMLVEQQVLESKSVVERPKRIKILLRSADFLWPLDRVTARSYFIEAFKTAGEHFAEKGFERKTIGDDPSSFAMLPDQRIEVIRAVAKRDGELAKKFLEQVLAEYEKTKAGRGDLDSNREQGDLLSLAAESVNTNPEFAKTLFRSMMRYPPSQNWFFSLYAAARSDQKFADAMYSEALQNYRGETPVKLLYLSGYPFGNMSSFGIGRTRYSAYVPEGFVPNPALQRSFLDLFFARVGSFSMNVDETTLVADKGDSAPAIYMVSAMADIEPVIVTRFPELLQRFSVARSQASALLTEDMRKEMTDQQTRASEQVATFEDTIKALEEAETEKRLTDFMILRVLFNRRLKNDEQFKKFEPWLAKIKEEKPREDTSSYFWYLRSELAIKEDRISEAEKMIAKIPELDHRSLLMFEIAKKQLGSSNDPGGAFDTLNRVSKVTHMSPNSVAKVQVLFGLVEYYDRINHSVALDELGETIRVINQLEGADILQNWIFRQIRGKEFGFSSSYSLPGKNLEGTFSDVGKKDFELGLANALALNDKYYRTLAVISVAGNCVQIKQPPPVKKSK